MYFVCIFLLRVVKLLETAGVESLSAAHHVCGTWNKTVKCWKTRVPVVGGERAQEGPRGETQATPGLWRTKERGEMVPFCWSQMVWKYRKKTSKKDFEGLVKTENTLLRKSYKYRCDGLLCFLFLKRWSCLHLQVSLNAGFCRRSKLPLAWNVVLMHSRDQARRAPNGVCTVWKANTFLWISVRRSQWNVV